MSVRCICFVFVCLFVWLFGWLLLTTGSLSHRQQIRTMQCLDLGISKAGMVHGITCERNRTDGLAIDGLARS